MRPRMTFLARSRSFAALPSFQSPLHVRPGNQKHRPFDVNLFVFSHDQNEERAGIYACAHEKVEK